MNALLHWVSELPAPLVYLVAAVIVVSETALLPGIVFPTLSTLLLLGFLAQRGVVNLWLAMADVAAAAVLGDQLAYLEGRRWGPRLRETGVGRRFGEARWERLETAVARYGLPAVMAGRCVAGVRTIMPRVAGSAAMPHRRFTLGSAMAVVPWAAAELFVGHTTATAFG
ncbi:DedA family protein [Amycolatopsis sp. CA-230715]|uniref:DedA family protein n=1 Tax=Amycolatopsis sp. CA-230715 TaxID=2745196 RepID=UPI001C0273B1|nr:VTT domain-containing protein [Amycolatopsis sp. CA-230715]QWF77705.1 Inner membrane protein YghB [Amycolatopsis sp. CA-230715]